MEKLVDILTLTTSHGNSHRFPPTYQQGYPHTYSVICFLLLSRMLRLVLVCLISSRPVCCGSVATNNYAFTLQSQSNYDPITKQLGCNH